MSNNGIAKIQHYVPQFLLKNFTHKKNQVYVFDKKMVEYFLLIPKMLQVKMVFIISH
ncbi:hypothetical protein CYL31_15030 [Marinomonas sp. A3A]|nr:hypothetical protein CYL31_15030 [Marinomonas sp. A3A]